MSATKNIQPIQFKKKSVLAKVLKAEIIDQNSYRFTNDLNKLQQVTKMILEKQYVKCSAEISNFTMTGLSPVNMTLNRKPQRNTLQIVAVS